MFTLFYTFLYINDVKKRIHVLAKPQRSSLRIHLCASERSERAFFWVFNSLTVKKVSFFTINLKFKVILSSDSGGGGVCLYRPSPPKKSGEDTPPHPPPPRELRQWHRVCVKIHPLTYFTPWASDRSCDMPKRGMLIKLLTTPVLHWISWWKYAGVLLWYHLRSMASLNVIKPSITKLWRTEVVNCQPRLSTNVPFVSVNNHKMQRGRLFPTFLETLDNKEVGL